MSKSIKLRVWEQCGGLDKKELQCFECGACVTFNTFRFKIGPIKDNSIYVVDRLVAVCNNCVMPRGINSRKRKRQAEDELINMFNESCNISADDESKYNNTPIIEDITDELSLPKRQRV